MTHPIDSVSPQDRTEDRFAEHLAPDTPAVKLCPPNAPWPDLSIGAIVHIPGYTIVEEIGRGGMAVVYSAIQDNLGRHVALKTLNQLTAGDANFITRFQREVEVLARLDHPNIVQIFEANTYQGIPYLTMELVRGGTLDLLLARGLPSVSRAVELVETIARAVHAAHQAGILHRDLKPGNILMTPDQQPKIADFGLARYLDRHRLTLPGEMIGTVGHTAPELLEGSDAESPAADVYALGVILFELLTGDIPFATTSPDFAPSVLVQVMTLEAPRVRTVRPDLPTDLDTICAKCLQRNPNDRYASAVDLADDLRRFREGRPIQARPIGPLGIFWRWCGRYPMIALLSLMLLLSLVGGLAGMTVLWMRADTAFHQATQRAGEATTARQDASQALLVAERELYFSDMIRLQHAWDRHRHGLMEPLLDRHRSEVSTRNDLRGFEWDFWNRQLWTAQWCSPEQSAFRLLVQSPGGAWLATVDEHGSITVWEVSSGTQRWTYASSPTRILAIAFRDETGTLVSVQAGRAVVIHAAEDGQPIQKIQLPDTSFPGYGGGHALDSRGRIFATCSSDGRVGAWEIETGRELLRQAIPSTATWPVVLSPDGTRLALCDRRAEAWIWDLSTGERIATLSAPAHSLSCLAFTSDNQLLATGGSDRQVRVWDIESGRQLGKLRTDSLITSLAFNEDASRVAVGEANGMVRVWHWVNDRIIQREQGHTSQVARSLFLDESRGALITAGGDGILHRWPQDEDAFPRRFAGSRGEALSVAVNREGTMIASAGSSGLIRLRFSNSGEVVATFGREGHHPRVVEFSPSGELLASFERDGGLILWDLRGRVISELPDRVCGHAVAFSPDGNRLAVQLADHGKPVVIWDIPTGQTIGHYEVERGFVRALSFSPNGHRLAIGVDHYTLAGQTQGTSIIWDIDSGEAHLLAQPEGELVSALAFSPDGRWLASGGLVMSDPSAQTHLHIWDSRTGEHHQAIPLQHQRVIDLHFDHQGRRLGVGAADGSWSLYETTGWQDLLEVSVNGLFGACTWAWDGCGTLAAGTMEGEVHLWVVR